MTDEARLRELGERALEAYSEAQDQAREIRGDELLATPDPDYSAVNLWNDTVIARGCMTLLCGAPKIGKSRFIMDMTLAASTGREFLGAPFTKPLRVLWVQAEIRRHYLKSGRIAPAVARFDDAERDLFCKNFFVTDRLDIDLTKKEGFAAVQGMIDRVNPDVVVIDPVLNFSSANENDAQEIKALLRASSSLIEGDDIETQPALVLVHHTKKVDKKTSVADPFELIRGSSAIRGYYDAAVLMLPDDSGATALHFETRNQAKVDSFGVSFCEQTQTYQPAPLSITKQANGQYSAIAKPDHAADAVLVSRYLMALSEPYYVTAGDLQAHLMDHLDISERQARRRIEKASELCQGEILSAGQRKARVYYHDQNRALVEPKL